MSASVPGNLTSEPGGSLNSLAEDERWLLANRIAASVAFSRSARLSQLLLYLCEHHLCQKGQPLTEQKIAAGVFGRRTSFDPAADTIVRSHMLRLRQKLETYFLEEGAQETMRITIPRGGYVPSFELISPAENVLATPSGTQPAVEMPHLEATPLPSRRWLVVVNIVLGVLCVILLTLLLLRSGTRTRSMASEGRLQHQLWLNIFRGSSPTLLVAADSGVVMLHGLTGQNSSLSEYIARDFRRQTNAAKDIPLPVIQDVTNRRYTSFVDLEFFDRMTHLPEALQSGYSIRYARDIHTNDLKVANVVFSGSQDSNPWIELFETQMNFVLHDDLIHCVRAFSNRNPRPNELALYKSDKYEYGVLAYLPNLSGTGNVLIVEGTSVAGTEAISDLLFEDRRLESFLEKIANKDGSLPHFELLLESGNLNGSASQSHIVAYRVH